MPDFLLSYIQEVVLMPKERHLPGKINYDKLFTAMSIKGIKKTNLRNDYKIHPTTIQKIIAGETINTDTIIILCDALNCQPGDIMEYVPDKPQNTADPEAQAL